MCMFEMHSKMFKYVEILHNWYGQPYVCELLMKPLIEVCVSIPVRFDSIPFRCGPYSIIRFSFIIILKGCNGKSVGNRLQYCFRLDHVRIEFLHTHTHTLDKSKDRQRNMFAFKGILLSQTYSTTHTFRSNQAYEKVIGQNICLLFGMHTYIQTHRHAKILT